MVKALKSFVKSFYLPAVFPEDEAEASISKFKSLRDDLKARALQAYEGRKGQAKLAW